MALAAAFGLGSMQWSTALADAAKSDAPPSVQPPADVYKLPAPTGQLPKSITIYQYDVCPFCCKVKAFLDFYKLPYTAIEVNPLTKEQLKWSSGYKKVPVIKLDEEVVVDSSAIISRLAAELRPGAPPSSQQQAAAAGSSSWFRGGRRGATETAAAAAGCSAAEEARWREWVDKRLVLIITANIYRSFGESLDTMSYLMRQAQWDWGMRQAARAAGTGIMWIKGRGMPKKYGIEGDLREALYAACNEFVDAVGPQRPFLGGSSPSLADLAVFGVLRAVEGTPTFEDAMAHSRIAPWYAHMREAVGPSMRLNPVVPNAAAAAVPAAA